MSQFQTYLELAVQEREQYYVYDEGFKETWEDLKSFASEIIDFTSKEFTAPILKDLSPKLTKLKKELNNYVLNLQNEYEQKVQSALDDSGVSLEKNKKRRWWNSSLFTEKEVLGKLKKQAKESLAPLKAEVNKQKQQISTLKSQSAISKREATIQEFEQKIKEIETKFESLSSKITQLFAQRNKLFEEKQKATEEQKEEINKKIERNAKTITKVVASVWIILSLVGNYIMIKLTGLGL